MILKIPHKRVYLLAITGIFLYIILIVIAMFYYPGGIMDDQMTRGYSFWENTISDLGRVKAWNDQSNITSMLLFSFANGIHIFTMIPFYMVFMSIFEDRNLEHKTSTIGSYFGILTSIAFIGILFTPADVLNTLHWFFAYIIYSSTLFMGIFYSITLFFSDNFTKKFACIFTMLFIIYFIALLVGLIGIIYSRTIMVIGQKIMTFVLLIDFSILICRIWKLEGT